MAHNDLLQRVALEALECGENTVEQLRDDLDTAIERYQQQRLERDTIDYDTWEDFADLLRARGRINPDLVATERRAEIVASYPHGPFANDGSHDLLWEVTGGPWFDRLEDQLIGEGAASDATRRAGDTPLHGWDSIEQFAVANGWELDDVLAEGVSQDDENGTIYVPGGFPEPIKVLTPGDAGGSERRALYMVLADGETYTPLAGCRIVAAPDDVDDEDLEEALKGRDARVTTVMRFEDRLPVVAAAVVDAEVRRAYEEANDVGAECSRLEADLVDIHDALVDSDDPRPVAINATGIIERIQELRAALGHHLTASAEAGAAATPMATRCCHVDVDELIERDLEQFLDLIAERAFGSVLASDLSYRVAGSKPSSGQLLLAVTADVSAILDEHDVNSLDAVPGLPADPRPAATGEER